MLFSRRHPKETRPEVSLPFRLRTTICYVLGEFNTEDGNGWAIFKEAEYRYRKDLGLEKVMTSGSTGRVESDLEGVIKSSYPNEVLDMVEAFLLVLPQEERLKCEHVINQTLQEYKQPWRVFNGQFTHMDSRYLAEEVLANARALLEARGFEGPLDEFDHAINAYSSGDLRGAITNAYSALESTIKSLLNVQREKPGRLLRTLIDSGLIPEYYQGFLQSVEQIIAAVMNERNEPGRGHGQGVMVTHLDASLAEFCLHLTGTLIVFLIKRYQEKSSFGAPPLDPEDLPF